MSTYNHTAITVGQSNAPATINAPLSELDAAIGDPSAITQLSGASAFAKLRSEYIRALAAEATIAADLAAGIGALTVDSEVVTARDSETVIKDRLDKMESGIINVRRAGYGAVGDGVTSDLSAFTAAFGAAAAGDTVLIPDGVYNIANGDVTIPDGVILRGDGATLSVNSGRRCFNIGSDVQIHGLKFLGNDDAGANNTNRFFQIQDETNILIRDCEFNNMGNNAITIGGSSYITIDTCRFTNIRQENGRAAINIGANDAADTGSTHIRITNCSFINPDIASSGAGAIIIVGDNTNNLQVEHVVIASCFFKFMGRTTGSTAPRGDIDVYNDVKHLKILHCVSLDSALGLTKCSDAADVVIDGNTILNSGEQSIKFSWRYGNTMPSNARIINNYIYNAGLDGIDITGSTTSAPTNYARDILVQGNIIDTTGRFGIQATEVTRIRIDNNIVRTPTNQGIYAFNATLIATEIPISITNNTVKISGTATGIATRPRDNSSGDGGLVITGNTVSDITATGVGIDAYQSNKAVIANNVFHDIGSGIEYRLTSVTLRSGGLSGAALTLTAAAPTIYPYESYAFDTTANAIACTLGSGQYAGQLFVCRMSVRGGTNDAVLTVTNHVSGSNKTFTHDAVNERTVLVWAMSGWATIYTGATFA